MRASSRLFKPSFGPQRIPYVKSLHEHRRDDEKNEDAVPVSGAESSKGESAPVTKEEYPAENICSSKSISEGGMEMRDGEGDRLREQGEGGDKDKIKGEVEGKGKEAEEDKGNKGKEKNEKNEHPDEGIWRLFRSME